MNKTNMKNIKKVETNKTREVEDMEVDLAKANGQKEKNITKEADVKQVSGKSGGVHGTRKKLTPMNEQLHE